MCGIFGAVDARLPAEAVKRMLTSLEHRGPDDWGVAMPGDPGSPLRKLAPSSPERAWAPDEVDGPRWAEVASAPVVLGHTRLSIVDTSRASHQPFDDGVRTLVFNGEIYNYLELRDTLRAEGHTFATAGDTEVLLAAYARWGTACAEHLNGCFAFAIWDRAQRTLFLARDRLGKKPLYWWHDGQSLVFASEIKALWATGRLDATLDPGVVARFLALGRLPRHDESFFAGLVQLPAASTLTWKPGRTPRIQRYWAPSTPFDQEPSDAASTLRDLLASSVALRYRADVPVGLSLSGGVDSSSLAVAAAGLGDRLGQPSVLTVSAVLPDSARHDERPEIDAVLDALGTSGTSIEPTFLNLGPDATFERFLDFVRLHDEPVRDEGVFHHFLFMRRIRALGLVVMISGQGADELFAGYPWYLGIYAGHLLRHGRPSALEWWREIRQRSGRPWRSLLGEAWSRGRPARQLQAKRSSATGWLRADAWDVHCNATHRATLDRFGAWPRYQAGEIFDGSLVGLLKDEDRNSMAHGVETRLPYLDYRLVEWATTLSPRLHFRAGHTKHLLRRAYRDRLPTAVGFSKRKQGFYVPLTRRFPAFAAHQDEVLDDLGPLDGVVDSTALGARLAAPDADPLLRWRTYGVLAALGHARARCQEAHEASPPARTLPAPVAVESP